MTYLSLISDLSIRCNVSSSFCFISVVLFHFYAKTLSFGVRIWKDDKKKSEDDDDDEMSVVTNRRKNEGTTREGEEENDVSPISLLLPLFFRSSSSIYRAVWAGFFFPNGKNEISFRFRAKQF